MLKDVAEAAQVSLTTASVVINNKVGSRVRVSPETRERIWAAAKSIGYVGNPVARRLAGGKNDVVAIFSYEPVFPIGEDDFYHSLLLGIEQEAEALGLDLLLVTYRGGNKDEHQRRINRLRFADGAILLGLERDEREIAQLVQSGYKMVVIGKRVFSDVDVSYVSPDYADATQKIVNHALLLGHQKFCFVQWEGDRIPSLEREIGFRNAIASASNASYTKISIPEDKIDKKMILELVQNGTSCFVIERYITAELILDLLSDAGYRVPTDVSLCVLGGPGRNRRRSTEWTTITIPGVQLGREAMRMLVALLTQSEREPSRQILPCEIEQGATLAHVPC